MFKHTPGKVEVCSGGIFEAEPKDSHGYPERPLAEMHRRPNPVTGAFLRPPTEADANSHHFAECWNACDGLDPLAVPAVVKAARNLIVSILGMPPCEPSAGRSRAYVDPEEVEKLARALNAVKEVIPRDESELTAFARETIEKS